MGQGFTIQRITEMTEPWGSKNGSGEVPFHDPPSSTEATHDKASSVYRRDQGAAITTPTLFTIYLGLSKLSYHVKESSRGGGFRCCSTGQIA